MRKIWLVAFIVVGLFYHFIAAAQVSKYEGEEVVEVKILGNELVSENVVLNKVKTKAGDVFSSKILNDDLNRLYDSGYFSNISIDVEEVTDGVRVNFIVKEKPMLKEIIFIGNKKIKSKKLRKKMKSVEGEVLNEFQIKEDIEAVKEYYESKGFTLAKIDYEISVDEPTSRAIVSIFVKEGVRVHIADIQFEENQALSARQIRKVMRTRKDGLFTSGILKEEQFEDDLEYIITLYRSHGYLDARIADVDQKYNDEGNKVWITIKIFEGEKYYTGTITITGNEKITTEAIEKTLKCKSGSVFNPLLFNNDMSDVRDAYYARGYLDARVRGSTVLDPDTGKMNISYKISEGEITYVRRVDVRGNSRTKDIVIRREVSVIPGEVCDSIKIKRSRERLQNLGYFEYVDVSLRPTDIKHDKDIVIEVKEQKTGEISFGAGYSSIDYLIGFVEISQSNFDITNFPYFLGGGQKMRIRADIGSKRRDYLLSFTEPWFWGRRLSFGVDLFQTTRKYFSSYFDENRRGVNLKLGKSLGEFNRADLIYSYQQVDITNVSDDASEDIKQEAGKRYVGTVGLGLTRDTRDSWIFPTRGYRIMFLPEVAGLGGNTEFVKLTGTGSIYFPLYFKHVLRLGAKAGVVDQYGNSSRVPIFDRFFLGGATTVRGFDYRDISPRDSNGEPIGGKTMGMGTIEYTFPLITRIRGAFFCDTGAVFAPAGHFAFGDLNTSVGVGVRLRLPIGPIQVDYGIPVITDQVNEDEKGKGRFSFSMGTTF